MQVQDDGDLYGRIRHPETPGGRSQVVQRCLPGGVGVSGLDRLEYGHVFLLNLLRQTRVAAGILPRPVNEMAQAAIQKFHKIG